MSSESMRSINERRAVTVIAELQLPRRKYWPHFADEYQAVKYKLGIAKRMALARAVVCYYSRRPLARRVEACKHWLRKAVNKWRSKKCLADTVRGGKQE